MKGLQNGIPIAMLAAMASAQGLGGGPRVDTGKDVGFGFSNKFTNKVNNFNKDDHSVDVHSQTNVLKAPPHPPHGGEHGQAHGGQDGHEEGARHQPRAGPASSDGVDVGSASELNYASEATHKVHTANVDDHHVDINEKHTITVLPPPPKHHPHGGEHEGHGKEHQGGHEQGEEARPHEKRWNPLDEEGAVDTGNSASYDFENEFYSKTNNANLDNHSLKVDDNTNIVTPPPHPNGHGGHGPEHDGGHGSEHERRDEHEPHRGPKYIDTGNDIDFTFENDFESEVNNYNEDNHGVDIKKNTNIQAAPPHGGPPHGRERRQERGDVDIGNAAGFSAKNEFSSKVNSFNADDHSVHVDKYTHVKILPPPHPPHRGPHGDEGQEGHHKRAYRPDADGAAGPGRVDTGNTANIQASNSVNTETNSANVDDHSTTVHSNVDETVGAPPQPEHHEDGHEDNGEHHKEEPTKPAEHHDDGHEETGEHHQKEPSKPAEHHEDGHEETGGHHQEEPTKPAEHHEQEPAQPVEHHEDQPAEPSPTCSTLTREVVHTVVRTVHAHSEPTHAPQQQEQVNTPAPQPEQPKDHEESGHDNQSHEIESPKPTGADSSPHEDPSREDSHGPSSTPVHGQPEPTGVDGIHNQEESSSHEDSHGPSSTPVHGQPKPTGVDSTHNQEESSSHEDSHGPSSTPVHGQPKPTGVDGTHNQEESSSHEDSHGPSSTPVHGQPKPTGVDGTHNQEESSSHKDSHGPSSTPVHGQYKATGVDGTHNQEEPSSHGDSYGPSSTPVHGQPQHAGDDGSHFDVPSSTTLAHIAMTPAPTHAPSHQHAVLTSTQTISRSSLHMVPIYVPQASSNGAHASETPAATPSAHVPVGVDAEYSSHVASGPATPSPSSHNVMFTGAAASLSPSAGVISLACGVIGLLAFVL
ncbi:hypothetical protein OAory_01055900 [Aspergillus oryzae]|uniref:GPI anchored protein n=1 Tax=Aspergillus oryzae TaxID=5062 RepID=A0A1S9DL39_ASPOZ|nr:hypothetical protein OAory_01055900 [Aspergillus oryzae]